MVHVRLTQLLAAFHAVLTQSQKMVHAELSPVQSAFQPDCNMPQALTPILAMPYTASVQVLMKVSLTPTHSSVRKLTPFCHSILSKRPQHLGGQGDVAGSQGVADGTEGVHGVLGQAR